MKLNLNQPVEVIKVFGMTGMTGKIVGYDNRTDEYIVRFEALQLDYRYKKDEIRVLGDRHENR